MEEQEDTHTMIKLRCIVEDITYQNPENGWSVMKVKVKGYDNLVTFSGSLLGYNNKY